MTVNKTTTRHKMNRNTPYQVTQITAQKRAILAMALRHTRIAADRYRQDVFKRFA